MICYKCKNELKQGAAFCGYCGTPVGAPQPMPQMNQAPQVCPSCGNNDVAGKSVCGVCGTQFGVAPQWGAQVPQGHAFVPPQQQMVAQKKDKKKSPGSLIILIVLIVLVLVLGGACIWLFVLKDKFSKKSEDITATVTNEVTTEATTEATTTEAATITEEEITIEEATTEEETSEEATTEDELALSEAEQKVRDGLASTVEHINDTTVVEESAAESEYILPNSDTEYISESDLYDLSEWECRLARNEIYARHGRLFDDDKLQEYFDSCSWYEGYIKPSDFSDSDLTSIEIANRDTIVAYENEMGYN